MGTQNTNGFTIIEVMLVLAITGLMLIGILVGTSAQITRQEYRSSVTALQSELQRQYSAVQNPENSRENADVASCGGARGASLTCFVVGRFVVGNGSELTEYPVIGQNSIDSSSDISLPLTDGSQWRLRLDTAQKEDYTLRWGSTVSVNNTNGRTFSLLVLMSPNNGTLETYSETGHSPGADHGALLGSVAGSPKRAAVNLCVVGGSSSSIGQALAVQVATNASSATGVVVPAQDEGLCK